MTFLVKQARIISIAIQDYPYMLQSLERNSKFNSCKRQHYNLRCCMEYFQAIRLIKSKTCINGLTYTNYSFAITIKPMEDKWKSSTMPKIASIETIKASYNPKISRFTDIYQNNDVTK